MALSSNVLEGPVLDVDKVYTTTGTKHFYGKGVIEDLSIPNKKLFELDKMAIEEISKSLKLPRELGTFPVPNVTIFLTGSRAYGIPRPDSDYDFVWRVTPEIMRTLAPYTNKNKTMIGNVNLIPVMNDTEFARWAEGTRRLMELAPVTREFAIDVFESLGIRRAVGDNYPNEKLADWGDEPVQLDPPEVLDT